MLSFGKQKILMLSGEIMKLANTFLCPGCSEVFDYSQTRYCPFCGNKTNLFLGKILNRKEGIDETHFGNNSINSPTLSNTHNECGNNTSNDGCENNRNIETSSNQSGIARSRRADSKSCINLSNSDRNFKRTYPSINALGIRIPTQSNKQQELSGIDADTGKTRIIDSQYIRRKPYPGKQTDPNKRKFNIGVNSLQGVANN